MFTLLSADLVFAACITTGTHTEPYLVNKKIGKTHDRKAETIWGVSWWFSLWLHWPSLCCNHELFCGLTTEFIHLWSQNFNHFIQSAECIFLKKSGKDSPWKMYSALRTYMFSIVLDIVLLQPCASYIDWLKSTTMCSLCTFWAELGSPVQIDTHKAACTQSPDIRLLLHTNFKVDLNPLYTSCSIPICESAQYNIPDILDYFLRLSSFPDLLGVHY